MTDLYRCSGPYRRVSEEEYDRLTAQGVPGEWDEGCGFVVYDQIALEQFQASANRKPAVEESVEPKVSIAKLTSDLEAVIAKPVAPSGEWMEQRSVNAGYVQGQKRMAKEVLPALADAQEEIRKLRIALNSAIIVAEADREAAKRWNALMACQRVRIVGYTNDMNHLGMEFWRKHPEAHPSADFPQERCRDLFAKFADGVSL